MEENLQEIQEAIEEISEEPIETIEIHNRYETYTPTEYQFNGWQNSWKKCRCGRITGIRDNWCPSCGQKLGRPPLPN